MLTEDDDQDGGGAVADGEFVGVHHTLDGCVLLGLGQLRAGPAAMARDGELGVDELALHSSGDEGVDEPAGAGPVGQPGIEVFLLKLTEW